MDEIKKKTDESWKEAVELEKEALKKDNKFIPPEPDFNFFITTLALQTAIALGNIANPVTNQKEEDLTQAKFLIDTIGMLKEKTKGNLAQEEDVFLENLLYELRTQYLSRIQGDKK